MPSLHLVCIWNHLERQRGGCGEEKVSQFSLSPWKEHGANPHPSRVMSRDTKNKVPENYNWIWQELHV